MNPARPSYGGLVARALEEAIETVTTRAMRESIIAGALRDDRRSSIPERGPEVLEFAAGALLRSLSTRVGAETAGEVLRQVAPILQRASMRVSLTPRQGVSRPGAARKDAEPSEVRSVRSDPGDQEDSGVFVSARALTDPAPRAAVPVVLLASHDPEAAHGLAGRFVGRATVRVVDGLLDLLDGLDDEDGRAQCVIVLDGAYPSVQVPSILTIAPDLAGRAKVVLWRCAHADHAALESQGGSRGWRACERTLDDLENLCAQMLRPA